jgi:FixJ family two-component response regulator
MFMSVEEFTGKVLFVDDERIMLKVLARHARYSGINNSEFYEDAETTVNRLRELKESGETVAAILSDGLDGDWRDIVMPAEEADTPLVVLSSLSQIQQEVEEAGAVFFNKSQIRLGFLATILAELQRPAES